MNKSAGKYFIVLILAISAAATVIGSMKAEAQSEAEWQKTLEAGKKEGKVSVYVSLLAPAVRKEASSFTKKFGIEVEVTTGRGAQMTEKLRTEVRTGANLADVVLSGSNPMFTVKKMGVTEPMDNKLILPEVIDTKLWYTLDRLPWVDDAKHLLSFYAYPNRDITINTDLVKPGEIQSWQDLLKPQYKGKIVWSDPSIFGSGFNGFSTNILHKLTDENYFRQLVATQDLALSRNLRQMAEWLARGKYAVAVSVEGGPIAEMLNAGAHIDYVILQEGAYLSYDAGVVGIAAKAPHPNAAKVFVNWLLSRDGQNFAQRATKYMSARNDIPTDGIVSPANMRKPGEKYFVAANTMEKWINEDQKKYLALAKEIFGPLIGR
ncbi:MAG: extracellular solute-binding protein [Desulfobacterales bacterium]|nr:extracellular solute-binding protein [Desulfobacterales bacterium]